MRSDWTCSSQEAAKPSTLPAPVTPGAVPGGKARKDGSLLAKTQDTPNADSSLNAASPCSQACKTKGNLHTAVTKSAQLPLELNTERAHDLFSTGPSDG